VTVVLEMLERLQQRFLDHFLGVGGVAYQPASQPQDAWVERTYFFRVKLKIGCSLATQFSWRTK
jgi:hypothetical protein